MAVVDVLVDPAPKDRMRIGLGFSTATCIWPVFRLVNPDGVCICLNR